VSWDLSRGVRAQFLRNHGWPSRPDVVEGLEVGRKLVALGRCCLQSLGIASDGRLDCRCLTARYRIQSREAGLKDEIASELLGVVPIKQSCRTRRWHHW